MNLAQMKFVQINILIHLISNKYNKCEIFFKLFKKNMEQIHLLKYLPTLTYLMYVFIK